jgi:hydroxypyruvate reductase
MKIAQAGLNAVDPIAAVECSIQRRGGALIVQEETFVDLNATARVLLVGAGKAGAAMAVGVEGIVGDRIEDGAIVVKYDHRLPLKQVRTYEAGHPVPDEAGLEGSRQVLAVLDDAGEQDLVISCMSGGGSALLPAPPHPITLADLQALFHCLEECGADIHDMNTVRKHVSLTTGGRLMARAFPARVLNLMISDVIGDDTDVIASGPFVPDSTTFCDAWNVLEKLKVTDRVPVAVAEHLHQGKTGRIPDTPKSDDPMFSRVTNHVIASNAAALDALCEKARELGYFSIGLSSSIRGETQDVALVHAAIAEEVIRTGNPVSPPACIVSGGETTVRLSGPLHGKGGRNQEFALSLAEPASRIPGVLFLSIGTDGTDGPTDAAGAWVDSGTVQRAALLGRDPAAHLARHDAYSFFEGMEEHIKTGPTGTNVMDLHVMLIAAR